MQTLKVGFSATIARFG